MVILSINGQSGASYSGFATVSDGMDEGCLTVAGTVNALGQTSGTMVIDPALSAGYSGTFPYTGCFVGKTLALSYGGRFTNPADYFDCTLNGSLTATRP